MPRVVSAPLAAHIARGSQTLATCWWVRRADGELFGFTSHDRDIEFEFDSDSDISQVVYKASSGMDRSAIEAREGMSVDNAEVVGFLDSDVITEDDVRAGRWDHAEFRIFEVNWADLTMGVLKQMRGWLGEVSIDGQAYTVELRGLATALNASVVAQYTPGCRVRLGDAKCLKDLTDYTAIGEVLGVASQRLFLTDLPLATVRLDAATTGAPPARYFNAGKLTWIAGANAGLAAEVRGYLIGGTVSLQLPMYFVVTVGDTFTVHRGCNKTRDECLLVFANLDNFRGYPDLPGTDRLLRPGGL